jgi:hypothetical protein
MTATTEFEKDRYSREKRSNITFWDHTQNCPSVIPVVKMHLHLVTEVEEADLPTRKITIARPRLVVLEQFSNSPLVDPINGDDIIPIRRFGQIKCEKLCFSVSPCYWALPQHYMRQNWISWNHTEFDIGNYSKRFKRVITASVPGRHQSHIRS